MESFHSEHWICPTLPQPYLTGRIFNRRCFSNSREKGPVLIRAGGQRFARTHLPCPRWTTEWPISAKGVPMVVNRYSHRQHAVSQMIKTANINTRESQTPMLPPIQYTQPISNSPWSCLKAAIQRYPGTVSCYLILVLCIALAILCQTREILMSGFFCDPRGCLHPPTTGWCINW